VLCKPSVFTLPYQSCNVLFCVFLEDAPDLRSKIVTLRSRLTLIVEPDFGLLDELLSLDVLTLPQLAHVQSKSTVYKRNKAVLDLLVSLSEDQCGKFVKALQRTSQPHIVNFITQNGGQKRYDVVFRRLNLYVKFELLASF